MKIIFFGDSVTETGRDHDNQTDLGKGYVKFAADELHRLSPELQILNRGVGGDGVHQLTDRLQRDVLDEKPDAIILQVGVNDVWWRETEENDFRSTYSALVASLKATGATLIIVQPFALPVDDFGRLRPRLNIFNKMIGEIAKENGVPVIPMDEVFSGATDVPPTQFTVDGIHPTPHGHSCIADRIVEELKKSIK